MQVNAIIGTILGLFVVTTESKQGFKYVVRVLNEGERPQDIKLNVLEDGTMSVRLDTDNPVIHRELLSKVTAVVVTDNVLLAPHEVGRIMPGTYKSGTGKCTAIVAEYVHGEDEKTRRVGRKMTFRVEGADLNALKLFFDAVTSGKKLSEEARVAKTAPKAAASAEPAPAAAISPVAPPPASASTQPAPLTH